MSATQSKDSLPQPHRRRTLWPGLVWSIPLAAFLMVGYLGIHAWARRGEVVTVTFRRAADAKPNDTKVLYQGVEAGHLVKIVPNEDGRRLDFQLRLRPEAKPGLNTNARFWLIGANPNLSDLSSLKAVVSGVAIGYAPGEGGTPTDRFDGLDRSPTVFPGDRGTHYVLTAQTLGSITEGAGILFHGQPIGKVTGVSFDGKAGFTVDAFIFRPYDGLIKQGARFWKLSPLRLSLGGGAVSATLAPVSTIFSGGIDMEPVTAEATSPQSPADSQFVLYANKNAARQGLSGPIARYEFAFAGAAGDLEEDAPVTLLGFQIGEVQTARLDYDAHSGKPFTRVTAVIYPRQLDLRAAADTSATEWQSLTDAKLRALLRFGYRARLQQTPALVGSESVALVAIKGAAAANLAFDGQNPRIPSAPGSSDMADVTSQAEQILAKVNGIPIDDIGRNLQQLTDRLNSLVASPQLGDSLVHLSGSLAQIDKMLADIQPKVGPLLTQLNVAADQISGASLAAQQLLENEGDAAGSNLPEALRQLSDAARSIRGLADYLDRHPEALIRGKRQDK